MATLWALKKPEQFTLPEKYQRVNISSPEEPVTGNYSFIKPIESDMTNVKMYLAGEYFETKDIKQFPEDNDLVEKTFVYPTIFYYTLYIIDGEAVIYCMGNNIDGIKNILSRHLNIQRPLFQTIDLDLVEAGYRNGLVQLSGHSFVSGHGTIKTIKRKIDGLPFESDDPTFESGEDIEREYLEVLVGFENINKKFNVYPSGKITCRGRLESGTDGFKMLRAVYLQIKEVIKRGSVPIQS